MARDSSGAKNQPQYAGTGAPSTAADQNEIANYAADVGNRKVGTESQRLALTGADVWDGLHFYETDTSREYVRVSGGWRVESSDWEAYTPSVTNAPGGTVTAKYRRRGKSIDVVIRHVSPAPTGQPAYTLPVNAADSDLHIAGDVIMRDDNVGTMVGGFVRLESTTAINPTVWAANGTYLTGANVTSSVPFTWATNDFLEARFTYESN